MSFLTINIFPGRFIPCCEINCRASPEYSSSVGRSGKFVKAKIFPDLDHPKTLLLAFTCGVYTIILVSSTRGSNESFSLPFENTSRTPSDQGDVHTDRGSLQYGKPALEKLSV
jgi:hypothetical protein